MATFTQGVGRYPRRSIAALTALFVALGGLVVGAPSAQADGPTTFTNSAVIDIPASGSPQQKGPAVPYPSTIGVSGLSGLVTNVTVTFNNLTHGSVGDIDAMVVAPSGQNIVVLSDVGDPGPDGPTAQLVTAQNIELTFSDSAAGPVPRVFKLPSGTHKPTNTNGSIPDTFPAPAPAPSSSATLAGAFTGISPNGDWNLFVVDDVSGEVGSMAGGWSLTITTEISTVATATTVTTSDATSTTGDPVTFTAVITAGGNAVTSGTVQFSDGGISLGSAVALDGSGRASLTTSGLAEGTHEIRATYNGATGFLSSNGTLIQRVDNPTVVTDNTFCNTGPLTIVSVGAARPYPSNITVSGLSGHITKVTATFKGLSHQAPIDLDVLLSSPDPSKNLFLLSDSGGQNPVGNVDVTFDDDAATGVPNPLISGTFKPTSSDDGSADAMPVPAPAPGPATTLSTFNQGSANGQWSLWVNDDASGDAGSISGGWCLTVTTQTATTTTLTSAPNPSVIGGEVTLTASVTAGGVPVSTGAVQFRDGASPIGAPVVVGADGKATLATSSLAAGSHSLKAEYSGTATLGASTSTLTQVVGKAATTTTLVSDVDPLILGQSVTFTATVSSGADPVNEGTVSFSVDGTVTEVAVGLSAGKATWTTSSLSTGVHIVLAEYSGGTSYQPSSSDSVDQTVNPVADAGGPYTVAEGGSLTLDGAGSSPGLVHVWDVNGDGVFGDASGVSPTLTWAQLEALGIDDGPGTRDVKVQVADGIRTFDSDSVTLTVTNTAPSAVVASASGASVGAPFTLAVGAKDPSSVDQAAQFTYVIDWGDGSPIQTVTGSSERSVTHAYASPSLFNALVTATDKDGGQGGPVSVQVRVDAAPSPSPSPTPSVSPTLSPTSRPSVTPSATPSSGQTDLYSTPGYHFVNGRRWFTTCEPYSQTVRCRTSIWATQVTYSKGAYHRRTGWYFNNLTYLPYMTRAQWVGNPLAQAGQWTAVDGRKWRTECDTPMTGGNGCRSWIWSDFIATRVDARGNRTYFWTQGWVFNNIVRFR
ncbi:MAG: Ig-like domain repeat protein [Propionibacteriaceae bacterium]|nr:Ig-like domain repeat protein [Propionibacteriaceae bacterium]